MTMKVMSNLKHTNDWNKILQARHNEILFKIEKFWSECDADGKDCVTELLLDTCQIQHRAKQVCSWEVPLVDDDGKVVPDKWQRVGHEFLILNNDKWRVSAKKDGMPRIHITAKVADELKEQHKDKRNLKVYE